MGISGGRPEAVVGEMQVCKPDTEDSLAKKHEQVTRSGCSKLYLSPLSSKSARSVTIV